MLQAVVERIGTQAICLKLSQQAGNIHDAFYVSQLELYVSDQCTAPKRQPRFEKDSEEEYELEELL